MPYQYQKEAMPVLIRDVLHHNWGFYSKEEQRLHIQTIFEKGKSKIKFFLENKGKRTFELAYGDVSQKEFNILQDKVNENREQIEEEWIMDCLLKGWIKVLKFDFLNQIIYISVYSGHNQFTRKVDLKVHFPGAYSNGYDWAITEKDFFLDQELLALSIGKGPNKDLNRHLQLSKIVFKD